MGSLALGTLAYLTGCTTQEQQAAAPGALGTTPASAPTPSPTPTPTPSPTLPPIPPPNPGPAAVIDRAPTVTQQIALTVDDGYCEDCVDGYVEFAQLSGIPLTFAPNAAYRQLWDAQADRLRPLIEAGQVQIGNHTANHWDVTSLSDAKLREEIESNDDWVQQTFGITTRPYFRPPYGNHSSRTDAIAGSLGYTKILLWNGSFGDSTLLDPDTLLGLARQYLQPGTIMLGHANHPTILGLFDEIQAILAERALEPVTLDTMFGTSRATG